MSEFITRLKNEIDESSLITDKSEMAKYITDWPGKITGDALAVLRPQDTSEVSRIMKLAYEFGVPVVPQGGNTGVAGGSVPDKTGKSIVISLERMNKVREISVSAMTITVEAGCILEKLQQIAEDKGLFFPLNFGAKGSCMIGGNLATNAGGQNVVRYGNTRELCLGVEAVFSDGRVMNLLSGLRKDNTGYDLRDLLIGSEGTLAIITAATMKLFHLPQTRSTTLAIIPSIDIGLELLNRVQETTGGSVEAFELIPRVFLELVQKHAPQFQMPFPKIPELCVLIEIAATTSENSNDGAEPSNNAKEQLESILESAINDGLVSDAVIASSESQRREMWEMRENALEIITKEGDRIGFDISLPLNKVQAFVDEMEKRAGSLVKNLRMCHLGHLGDGNLHYAIFPPEEEPNALVSKSEEIKTAVYDAISKFNGSFSAEHGIGTSKLFAMDTYKDPVALEIMQQIKTKLDPKMIMNPGKLLP
jgi:FAD/FMN-containing dehydrogenase